MNTMIRFASLLGVTLLLPAPHARAATEAPPRDPAAIYRDFCATCHEITLTGFREDDSFSEWKMSAASSRGTAYSASASQ